MRNDRLNIIQRIYFTSFVKNRQTQFKWLMPNILDVKHKLIHILICKTYIACDQQKTNDIISKECLSFDDACKSLLHKMQFIYYDVLNRQWHSVNFKFTDDVLCVSVKTRVSFFFGEMKLSVDWLFHWCIDERESQSISIRLYKIISYKRMPT